MSVIVFFSNHYFSTIQWIRVYKEGSLKIPKFFIWNNVISYVAKVFFYILSPKAKTVFFSDPSFLLVGSLQNLFQNLLLISISFLGIYSHKWSLRVPLLKFFVKGACLYTISMKVFVKKSQIWLQLLVLKPKPEFLTSFRKLVLLKFFYFFSTKSLSLS